MDMMDKYYQVTCNGDTKSFIEGTTYKAIADFYKDYYDNEILIAKVDDDFEDLCNNLRKDCNITFYTVNDEYGNTVYSKSARFILFLAVRRVLGPRAKVIVVHSQDRGIFFEIDGVKVDDAIATKLNREFQAIVDSDYLFTHLTVSRLEAINFFNKKKMYDKSNMLKYIANTYINLYRIDDMYDYFYSKMAYSTGQINSFKIQKLNSGYVLQLPGIYEEKKEWYKFKDSKVHDIFFQAIKFSKSINIKNAAELNEKVSIGNSEDIIMTSEAYYDMQLMNLADEIINKKSRVVLIAGPSSSGKTTTSKKLSIFLKSKGCNTISISLDDYFIDLIDRKKLPDGSYDFESIDAVNTKLFSEQVNQLLSGQEINLPYYDFIKGVSNFRKEKTKISKNDIIVVEGIHALNDTLSKNIDSKYKHKVYISPLASINIDNHNPISADDIRKLRRIIRDNRTRGLGASETLSMWPEIKKGEMVSIFPYQSNVNSAINSSLIYEVGVLKTYAEPLLYSISQDDEQYPEALRLINFLKSFLPIPSDDIPIDSVIREFIGGSCFK